MDPVVIAGGLAAAFALLALMLWRRAADLEEQVRALEAKLAEQAPKKESAPAEEAKDEEDEEDEDERAEAAESDDDDEEEDEEASGDEEGTGDEEDDEDEEEEVAAAPAPPTEQAVPAEPVAEAEPAEPEPAEPERAEPEPAEPEPAPAAAAPAEPARKAEPDPRRLEALKIVTEAFELARYLDFDAIVEKPSTYRVTIPITAANGSAVRFLEDGMFTCLSQVRIEDGNAILHIDTGKGPP